MKTENYILDEIYCPSCKTELVFKYAEYDFQCVCPKCKSFLYVKHDTYGNMDINYWEAKILNQQSDVLPIFEGKVNEW